jgi:hypothetical protein
MKGRRLTLLTTAAASFSLLLTAAPAHAEQRTIHDMRGDAPARLDITKYTVTNTSARLTAVIHVRHLRKTGTFQQRYLDSDFDDEPSYGVQVRRGVHGHLHVHAFRDDENGDQNIPCPGVRGHWFIRGSKVTTSMPVACANGTAFDPLHVHAVSFDPGDLGVADSTRDFTVQRD